MSSVTTNKFVNLGQLAAEMSGVDLAMSDTGAERTITSATATQAALQTAVDAHVGIDEGANRRTIDDTLLVDRTRLAEAQVALDAINAKTNANIGPADTKEIARQLRQVVNCQSRILRKILGDFTGTN